MDCRDALERLEVVRPDSADLTDPELAEAAAHLRAHPECEREFRARQALDRRVGEVMRDVLVPEGLRNQILGSLSREEVVGSGVERLPAATGRRRRIAWGLAATVAAALLAVGLFWWISSADRPLLADGELRALAVAAYEQFDSLPAYAGTFAPELPDNGWDRRVVSGLDDARTIPLGREFDGAAAYRYVIHGRSSGLSGVLLIVPVSLVASPPPPKPLPDATAQYSGTYVTVLWTEGDRVYVCLIDGPPGDTLQRLRDALSSVRGA